MVGLRVLTVLEKHLNDILFWDRWQLPTAPQMLVLEHLALEGEPRLYLYGYQRGYLRGSVSNSASVPGWDVRCDLQRFFWDVPREEYKSWVERDEVLSADKKNTHSVYKISTVGKAIIEWAHSHGRYGAKTPSSPQALTNLRRKEAEEG